MNDAFQSKPPDSSALPPPSPVDDSNALTSDSYGEFLDALDLLYIRANLSGRLKFLEAWPQAAREIFGEELIGFDHKGTTDVERRVALEEEAEERRLELLGIAQTLEEKSVEKNVLQVEYVESTVKDLGRDIALLMYAEKIVNRFIPAPVGAEAVESEVTNPVAPPPMDVPDEFADAPPLQPVVAELDDDNLDAIQPISLDPAPGGSPATADIPAVEEPPQAQAPAKPTQPPLPEDDYEEPQTLEEAMNELAEKKAAEEAAKAEAAGIETPPAEVNAPAPDVAPEQPADMSPPPQAQAAPAPAPSPSDVLPDASPDASQAVQNDAPPLPEASVEPVPSSAPEAPRVQTSAPDTVSVAPRGGPPPSDPTVQDVSAQARHKALDDGAPIASQKMTFMPSKQPGDTKKSQGVPVVGEKKDDDGA